MHTLQTFSDLWQITVRYFG